MTATTMTLVDLLSDRLRSADQADRTARADRTDRTDRTDRANRTDRADRTGPARPRAKAADLTDRESAVAAMVGLALSNKQIARRMLISPHTVNYHLRQIYRKLDINSRLQLAQFIASGV